MLMALGPGGRTSAQTAARMVEHRCAQCSARVTLKRGRVVTPHFAHARSASCAWARGETAQHLAAKAAFARAFARRGLATALEAEVLSGEGDRRADVLVRDPRDGAAIAIEVQHSPLSIEAIERRTRAYAAAGVGVIWVPTFDFARADVRAIGGTRLLAVDRYAAPAWQRFAAAYHGVLWFWSAGALWRGWLEDAWIARPRGREDDGGDSGGGDGLEEGSAAWARSRRWSAMTLDGPFAPEALRIARRAHRVPPDARFGLPVGVAANFVVAGEAAQPRNPAAIAWFDRGGCALPRLAALRPSMPLPRVAVHRAARAEPGRIAA